MPEVRVRGPRLRLRPLRAADAPAAFALLEDPRVSAFLNQDVPEGPEELARLYMESERLWSRGEAFYFAAERPPASPNAPSPFLGMIGVRFRSHPLHGNLGYWLGRPSWGQGLGTELVGLAAAFAFLECHCARVDAFTRVDNRASRRVLEKAGFRLDGVLRWNTQQGGEWHDEAAYTLLRPHWRDRGEEASVRIEKPEDAGPLRAP